MKMLCLWIETKEYAKSHPLQPRGLSDSTTEEKRLKINSCSYRAATMKRAISLIFLFAAVKGDFVKHIFVPTRMPWHEAHAFCTENYTDLSSISSQSDQDKLTAAGGAGASGWIGLHRDPVNMTAWMWSGGGHITYHNWLPGQPDNFGSHENYGYIMPNGKWNDEDGSKAMPFFCISIGKVRRRRTWEEARMHCRNKRTNLISLMSETDNLLAKRGFKKERVWIGLRFLHDQWLWVNGDPLVYQAWSGDQDQLCPLRKRCGTLTSEGLWENWDCQDKLRFICYWETQHIKSGELVKIA